MPYIFVRHKVRDFSLWQETFERFSGKRTANGSKGGLFFRNADQPDEIMVLLEWDTLPKARQFITSEVVGKVMEEAGVTDIPDVWFLADATHVHK